MKGFISRSDRLAQSVTPIFSPAIGKRMRLCRMKSLLEQKEIARLLGVSQSQVSRLEQGKVKTIERPFTLARFQAVFGQHVPYILWEAYKERYLSDVIRQRYWKIRLSKDPVVRAQFLGKGPVKKSPGRPPTGVPTDG